MQPEEPFYTGLLSTYSTRLKHDLYISFDHRPVLQADDCRVAAHIRKYLENRHGHHHHHHGCAFVMMQQCDLTSVFKETYCAVLLFGAHTLKYQLFLHNYFHLEVAAITFPHT